jgi:hypothetical protein
MGDEKYGDNMAGVKVELRSHPLGLWFRIPAVWHLHSQIQTV